MSNLGSTDLFSMGTFGINAVVLPNTDNRSDVAALAPAKTVPVLHVINGEHYSGAERVQDLLALELPKFGYEVSFACLKEGKFAASRRSQNAAVHPLAMAGRFDLRVVSRLTKVVREGKYEILHAHTPRSLLVARLASAQTGVPLVYHVHSPTARDSTRRFQNWANSISESLSLRGAARLICVSQSLGRAMCDQGFGERVFVVPNGVPVAGPLSNRPTPRATWTIGTVALFRPRKGTEVLIEALALLREQNLPARLICVGGFETPEYEATLKECVKKFHLEDRVEWTGFTRDVAGQLERMDLFALPSLFGEGLPMVVLEAMAAGVPVAATDVEGTPEAVRNGIDGVIAKAGDAEDFAAALALVMRGELDWQMLRENAHARQANYFSDRSMAAGVSEVYDSLLKPRREAQ